MLHNILSLTLGASFCLAGSLLTARQAVQTNTSTSVPDLLLGPIYFAGYDNYVYRDDVTSAQVVLSANASTDPSRLILAFPKGNTGALTYFLPFTNGSTLDVGLDRTSLRSVSQSDNQTGLSGNLTLTSDATLGVTLIGSVRTLRDYTEGSGLTHEIFNYTLGEYNASSVQLVRHWINGTTVQYFTLASIENAVFNVTPSSNVTLPPTIDINRNDSSGNASISFTCTFNYTDMPQLSPGLQPSDVFLSEAPNGSTRYVGEILQALQGGGSNGSSGPSYVGRAQEVSFLTYEKEFLAGGWRFLTYFGRDTLLALRLLLPIISPTGAEAVLGAVLERINTTGAVCHEETIGDYASFININNNQSQLGSQPSYNYVMVDTDFLLLPSLGHYFLSTPQGQNRSQEFLETRATLQNGTYQELLMRNVDHVLNLSRPFVASGQCTDLVAIRDPVVGNWRDSSQGLGFGKFPFDVNTALVPGALRSIAALANNGILPSNYSSTAEQYASAWESHAERCFAITIPRDVASQRLENYVQQANLSDSLLYGLGSLNTTASNSTDSTDDARGGNFTFYALSLDANATKVEIMNSDLGFTLLYNNNVSSSILQATVDALKPYPRGLLTNVGMVVANAAYDRNTSAIATFDETAYHGAVVWSWQQALMAAGIVKQLSRCGENLAPQVDYLDNFGTTDRPSWCNTTLMDDLLAAQTLLWYSIAGAESALYTEVWSPIFDNTTGTFSVGDLGAISPTGTEGDAIQLWSYGFLAAVDPRNGTVVASGTV